MRSLVQIRSSWVGQTFVVLLVVGIVLCTVVMERLSFWRVERDARRVADIHAVQQGLRVYYQRNKTYPASLSLLAPKYIATTPTDPLLGSAYMYNTYATSTRACLGSGLGYHLGAALEGYGASSVLGNADAPAASAGMVMCAGGSTAGFSGVSDKCGSTVPAALEGGDNCYDTTN